MRVLMIHNFYQHAGGEDTVFLNEQRLLRESGVQVDTLEFYNAELVTGSKLTNAKKLLWNSEAEQKVEEKIRSTSADIIHVHNFFAIASPAIYEPPWAARLPVIQTLHNYRLLCPAATFFRAGKPCTDCLGTLLMWPGIRQRCYRSSVSQTAAVASMVLLHRLRRTWITRVTKYIALTPFMKQVLISNGFPSEAIAIKPNFIFDTDKAPQIPREQVIFIGRLAPEKGLAVLIAAWRQLQSPIPLLIAGEGPLREELKRECQDQKHIRFVGQLSHDAIVHELHRSRFLVLPSIWYEGFPMVILEAFAAGVPVVASRLGGIPDIVEENYNGQLFDPMSSQSLATIVFNLWNKSEDCASMGLAARETYRRRYSPESNRQMLMSIYSEAIAAKGK